jgi:DNA-directed RNA polymerase subunit omega
MIYPSTDKIDEQVESKYALVILAAKRAKQLKEGSRKRVSLESPNALTIALEEIAEGQIQYRFDEESLAGREAISDQKAVVGAREIEVDIDPLALPDDAELLRLAKEALGVGITEESLGGDDEESDESELLDEETEEEEEPILLADDEADAAEV